MPIRYIYNTYLYWKRKKYVYARSGLLRPCNIRAFNKIAASTEILWIRPDNAGRRRMANGKHKNLFAGPTRTLSLRQCYFLSFIVSDLWDLESCASNKTLVGFIIKILLKFYMNKGQGSG